VRAPPTTEGRHTEARWHACARGQQLLGNLGAVRSAARTQGYPFAVLQRMAGVAARQQGGYRRQWRLTGDRRHVKFGSRAGRLLKKRPEFGERGADEAFAAEDSYIL